MELTKLNQVVCINLDFHLWSGRKKLRIDDFKIIDGEVPPEAIASLGSKKIANPDDIADFEAMKKEAERKCAKAGVKFLGGFAVPENKAAALAPELDEIVTKFYARKATFLAEYDTRIREWVEAHPGWERIIRDAALDRSEVDGKLSAGWQAFKIVEADDPANGTNPSLNHGLATAAKGLAGQLYVEIAKAAAEVMEKSLSGRDKVTQKILSPIRTIRDKLEGLSFIDKRVKPLVQTIDHVLEQLPAAGHIDGLGLSAIHGLVFILSKEDRMQQHGEMILAGKPIEESFILSVPKPAAAMPVPTVPEQQPVQQSAIPMIPAALPQSGVMSAGTPAVQVLPAIPAISQLGLVPPPAVVTGKRPGLFA